MDLETIKAAMLGVIVGDALGVPVEFMSRDALISCPVTDMRAYGTHDQPAGTWSDDSSMTLCLMESLTRGVDYDDMASNYLRWRMRAIGLPTVMSLTWALPHERLW